MKKPLLAGAFFCLQKFCSIAFASFSLATRSQTRINYSYLLTRDLYLNPRLWNCSLNTLRLDPAEKSKMINQCTNPRRPNPHCTHPHCPNPRLTTSHYTTPHYTTPQSTAQKNALHHPLSFALLFTLSFALLVIPNIGWPEIYKHVDQNGNTVFSDSPSKESSKVELQELPIINFPSPPATEAPKREAKAFRYSTFKISSPKQDETIRDNNGTINVTMSVDPALKKGHRLQLLLDGSPSNASSTASTFKLENVDRGSHSLQANVFDKENKLIQSTASITIHLHQFSKLHKK